MMFHVFKIFIFFVFLVISDAVAKQSIIEGKIFIQTTSTNHSTKQSYIKKQKVNSNISSYQSITYTFKQFGILSEDLVLKEVYPSWSFYIPVYPGYEKGKINLLLTAWGLGKDSYVRIYVDDIPYVSFKANELPPVVTINLPNYQNKDFIKISIGGFLGYSDNICKDIIEGQSYLIVKKDSQITLNYKDIGDIYSVFKSYEPFYSILPSENLDFYSLAFYLSKQNHLTSVKFNDPSSKYQIIYDSNTEDIQREGNILKISPEGLDGIKESLTDLLAIGTKVDIKNLIKKKKKKKIDKQNLLTFADIGYTNSTSKGLIDISQYFTIDTSQFGGIPKDLKLKLHIAHTPVIKSHEANLRVYLNDKLIQDYSLDRYGDKTFDFTIPSLTLQYGPNTLKVIFSKNIDSDKCSGGFAKGELTVFEDSYFYWNSVEKIPYNISDFIKSLHGKVLFVIKDPSYIPYLINFLSELGKRNTFIDRVDISANIDNAKNYDFIILFGSDSNINLPVESDKGEFIVKNPLTDVSLFSSKYYKKFVLLEIGKYDKVPVLAIQCWGQECNSIFYNMNFENFYRLFGNVGIFTQDYFIPYQVGKKLSVTYTMDKGIAYYWNKYKLILVIVIGLISILFLGYVYKKLAMRVK